MPDLSGLKISPNTATSVGLSKEKILRMPPPYPSRCAADWERSNFRVTPTLSYTFEVLRQDMRQLDRGVITDVSEDLFPSLHGVQLWLLLAPGGC